MYCTCKDKCPSTNGGLCEEGCPYWRVIENSSIGGDEKEPSEEERWKRANVGLPINFDWE